MPMLIQSTIRDYAKKIAIEKGITTEKVQPILERKWIVPTGEDEYLTTSVKYRAEEYEALSGEVSMSTDDYGDFLREGTEISNYAIPFINNTQHDTTKKRSHKSGSSCYFRGMRGYISISKSSGFRRLPGTAIFL